MKKNLAKAVLMSLLVLGFTNNSYAAVHFIIDDSGNNPVVIDGTANNRITDNSTIVDTNGGITSDTTITEFLIQNSYGNEQINVNLVKRQDRDYVYSSTTLKNSADAVIEGSALGIFGHDNQGNEINAINNTGKLSFKNEIRFMSQIYNANGGSFVSNEYLHGVTLWGDGNHEHVSSFGNIVNEGEMQINGRLRLVADNTGNNTLNDVIINNSGILNLKTEGETSSVVGRIVNTGKSDFIFKRGDEVSLDIENGSGEMKINTNDASVFINTLDNSGKFTLESNGRGTLVGDIKHQQGADTYIKLGDDVSEDDFDVIEGTITGSDYGNFKLVLEKSGEWWSFDENGNIQSEPVSGVELNGGKIVFSENYWIPSDSHVAWYDRYSALMLNNFNSNGKFGTTSFDKWGDLASGGIYLFTDLKNDVGDKVIFTGTTPNTTVPLGIYNKNDNNGIPIVREDGHSVTIIEAPSDTKMQFKTNLLVYGTPSQEFLDEQGSTNGDDLVDCDNWKVYKAQIDEIIDGNTKYWNFVGWEETEDNRSGKQESQKEAIEHSILVEDVEPIFKRFNDLRTDPSEIGVWVRGETGETKIRNLSYDHNIMSGGYDWDYKNDAGVLFAGVGFTYSTNECDDKAIGDTKGYGFNAYGSWLGKKNNDYVDLVVKYGKLDKSYAGYDENNIFVAGDYDKDLFTIAAKYGRRIFKDDWYYEPSVGLTWGRVGSADFTDNHGTRIHADNSYSNIASLGIQVGKNIKGIEYYGKAEVMHDFDGKIHVSAPGRSVEDDMGGTWVKCAIGASRKIDENNSFYLEVERDFGNKVEKPYGFSAGYRFTW